MIVLSRRPKALLLLAMLALPVSGSLSAQDFGSQEGDVLTVYGSKGPEIEGIISARDGDRIQVTADDGTRTIITIDEETKIKARGGFLGLGGNKVSAKSLLAGLPVTVETLQAGKGLLATEVKLKNGDLKTAAMIHGGTAQQFAAHGAAISKNAAAAAALRSRMGDIDKYNIKGTTNVYFDSGKWKLSPEAENNLCSAASEAEAMDNALLLVVGYTDSTGSYEINQQLSEKRATRVVNYLQQTCGWKPYRMLTPTGMAESDPMASNDTPEGKAQNRRVSVNVLVSKGLDGL